ncbi:hypothetical protein [Nesterenkonia jeotgali]|uniref:Uncharacterized protein n=1 Tax=Nesterenkonia jeotgali TaxID=317018 RepID=A0A839FPY6_9MICC|nr:hypothetical protein [Nesterenkonia jeotgali]MBA8920422.1 hypothetical protein [Nesterenkonia jeotgali]
MIDNWQAKELLDAIETYGDRERIYGRELQKNLHSESAMGVAEERNNSVNRALNEVKRLLQPFLDNPSGPHGLYDVPDRGSEDRPEEVDDFEVKWGFQS